MQKQILLGNILESIEFIKKGFMRRLFINTNDYDYLNNEITWEDGEMDYEKQMTIQSVYNLLLAVTKNTPMIIIINNITHLSETTFKLIEYMETKDKGRLFFVYSFNNEVKIDDLQSDNFSKYIKSDFIAIDLYNDNIKNIVIDDNACFEKNDASIIDIKSELNKCFDLLNFYCLSECKYYSEQLYKYLSVYRNNDSTDSDFLTLLKLIGKCELYLNDYDAALLYYHQALDIMQRQENAREICYGFISLSYTYQLKNNFSQSGKYAELCLQLAKKFKDKENQSEIIFMVYSLISFEDYFEIYKNVYDDQLLDLFYKVKNLKLSMYINSRIYFLSKVLRTYGKEKLFEILENNIKESKKIKNYFRLAIYYQMYANFLFSSGYFNKPLEYYKKAERIKINLGNIRHLLRFYSGFVYYCISVEDYNNAIVYFNKIIYYMRYRDDFVELSMNLMNIAQLYFFSFNYAYSAQYVDDILSIMKLLNLKTLPFHSNVKILSLIGLAFLKENNINMALLYSKKLENLVNIANEHMAPFEYSFFYLFSALLYKRFNDIDKAKSLLDKALKNHISGGFSYSFLYFYYECGIFYKELHEIDKANEYFMKGISYCENGKFLLYYRLFNEEINNLKPSLPFPVKKVKFDKQYFIVKINENKIINDLHKKIFEINFLNNIQKIAFEAKNIRELILMSLNLFKNDFQSDYVPGIQDVAKVLPINSHNEHNISNNQINQQ